MRYDIFERAVFADGAPPGCFPRCNRDRGRPASGDEASRGAEAIIAIALATWRCIGARPARAGTPGSFESSGVFLWATARVSESHGWRHGDLRAASLSGADWMHHPW